MNYRVSILVLFFLLILGCRKVPNIEIAKVPTEYSFANQNGYVNDFDDILTLEEEKNLEKILTNYDIETTNEIGVVSLKSIKPFKNIIELNDALLQNWRFGKDDKFNGLIILIDKSERQISIRFGIGIQTKLSDAETQLIIDKIITPEFKNGNFYLGITKGIDAIKKELK